MPASISTAKANGGERSLLLGLIDGANANGASVARQGIRLPSGNGSTVLTYHYYPLYNPVADTADGQYVEIFNDFNSQLITRLDVRRSEARDWGMRQFDLTPYAGQQITIYFGVYNDGEASQAAMYVDDVSIISCNPPDGNATNSTASGAESRSVSGADVAAAPAAQVAPAPSSTPTPTPTPTSTSTSTSTPTPTPTTTVVNTAVTCSTSVAGPLSVTYTYANGNQSATLNIIANNSTSVTVTGPASFTYTNLNSGPYIVPVPLQPNQNNVFNVTVQANQTNGSCQVVPLSLIESYSIAGPTTIACPTTTPEPLSVELLDTGNPLTKIIRVTIGNGDQVIIRGPKGTETRTGNSPFEVPMELNPNTANTFEIDAHVRSINLGNGCVVGNYTLRRTITYTDQPDIIPTPVQTPVPTIEPSTCGNIPMAPRPGSCRSIVINGGFETNEGWHFGADPVEAAFTSEQVSVGGRSMLLGNPGNRGDDNIKTYSSIRQPVKIPANVEQLQLRWRRFDVSEDGASANPANTEDRQDVIILSAYPHLEPIEIVSRLRCNSQKWQEFAFNLDARRYAQDSNIVLYFNVYNDGLGGRSWSYVDNVELLVCGGAGAYSPGSQTQTGKNSYTSSQTTYVNPPAFSATSTFTPPPVAVISQVATSQAVILPTATGTATVVPTAAPSTGLETGSTLIAEQGNTYPVPRIEATIVFDSQSQSVPGAASLPQSDGNSRVVQTTDGRGLADITDSEPTNQFMTSSPWFNWLTSCGILLGILGVITYFAWGILRTLADGPEPYEELDDTLR